MGMVPVEHPRNSQLHLSCTPDLKFLTHTLFSSLLGKVLESSPQKERPKIVPTYLWRMKIRKISSNKKEYKLKAGEPNSLVFFSVEKPTEITRQITKTCRWHPTYRGFLLTSNLLSQSTEPTLVNEKLNLFSIIVNNFLPISQRSKVIR